jgi:large subunit ribosomal protein L30
MTPKLRIVQVKSCIDRRDEQKKTLRALGLGRIHQECVHPDTPHIRGMIRKVEHLVKVEENL